MTYRTFSIGIISALPLIPATAQAQQAPRPVALDTVVVSAAKAPAGRAPTLQAVTVITGDELRATGVVRVADALRTTAGATVLSNGSFGSVTSLFLRGGESRYTKVLIDGVTVNAVGGYFDFSHLTTANVERIEIVRGPASVVHGADAMTGVVQIFTRKGEGPATVDASARAGTYSTTDADVAVRGGSGRTRYSLGGARHSTDGILAFNNRYYNGTLSGGAVVSPDDRTRIELSSRYTDAEFHYPTDFDGTVNDSNSYRDQHRFTVGLDVSRRLARRFELRLLGGSNYVSDITDDIDATFCPAIFTSCPEVHSRFTSRTRRRTAEARFTLDLPRSVLTTGLEYVRERERSVSAEGAVGAELTPTSSFAGTRVTRVGFAELAGAARWLEYTVSARRDDPSDFDAHMTYRAGLGARLGSGLRLRGGFGTAFNAPSFSQLLPTAFTTGSPGLEPERARSWEVAIERAFAGGKGRIGATYFDQTFADLIQFVPGGPPDFRGSYSNLAEARSRGWEAEVRAVPVVGWVFTGSFTHVNARVSRLDARYSGSLEVSQPLIRRPRRTASGSLSYVGWDRGTFGLAVRHVGSRPDLDFREFPSPTVRLPAYAVADLSGSVRILRAGFGRGLSLTARVENLFGREYEEILYYQSPGRAILVGGRVDLLIATAIVTGYRTSGGGY